MAPTVVIVGLGFAGVSVANELDGVAHVVAIDRHAGIFHNLAGPLAIVDAGIVAKVRQLALPRTATSSQWRAFAGLCRPPAKKIRWTCRTPSC